MTSEERTKVNTYITGLRAKLLLGMGKQRKLAGLMLNCIDNERNEKWGKYYRELWELMDPEGCGDMADAVGESHTAFKLLLEEDEAAEQMQTLWTRCTRFPYSTGWYGRSFRSRRHSTLYLQKNLAMLREMLEAQALGTLSLRPSLRRGTVHQYGASPLLAAQIALCLDQGDAGLLEEMRAVVYGEAEEDRVLSRELIQGALMSRSADAHKLMGELLLAARLQEGLRQAVVESMDRGSREGFVYLLDLILEHNLTRFSSVVRALDVWTGLGLPPDKPGPVKKCMELARRCLTDPAHRDGCLESRDNQEIYMALWAICFDEAEDVLPAIRGLVESGEKHRQLVSLYFLRQTRFQELQDAVAMPGLASEDWEILAWVMASILPYAQLPLYGEMKIRQEDFPPSHPPRQVYDRLRAVLERMPKKELAFAPSVFPWSSISISKTQIIEKMMVCAAVLEDTALVDELVALIPQMGVDARRRFVVGFLKKPRTQVQKTALVEALGDKSSGVRREANRQMEELSLSDEDYLILEQLMRFKSGDLRKNCIALLLRQKPKALVGSVRRLGESAEENQRLGALELVDAIRKDKKLAPAREAAERLAAGIQTGSQVEALRAGEILDADRPSYTPENGFGLYNPDANYTPVLPESAPGKECLAMLEIPVKRIKTVYQALSDLVHRHREHQYETTLHDGSKHSHVLGSSPYLPPLERNIPLTIDAYPLAEVWREFAADMKLTQAELMGMRYAVEMAGAVRAHIVPEVLALIRKELGAGHGIARFQELERFFRKFPYVGICHRLLEALGRSGPAAEQFQLVYPLALALCRQVPEKRHAQPYVVERVGYRKETVKFYYGGSRPVRFWLQRVNYAAQAEDGSFRAYFDLVYRFYQLSGFRVEGPGTAAWGRALELGLVEEQEVLRELLGRSAAAQHLDRITSPHRRWRKEMEPWTRLDEVSRRAIDRIVELEVDRGELPTPVSKLAAKVHRCQGARFFVAILLRMEKDSYVRGYNFVGDDSTRKNMLSHLLRGCSPAQGDDAAALGTLLEGKKISDRQMVEAAMYAPKWVGIVQDYLDWPGLESVVWYFHAHMNDHFSEEKQSVVARYSAIAPADFRDGAFDVNWFWEAYGAIGEKRFETVYKAAKYVAGSAQHRRAQLFADAVRGKLDQKELEEEIAGKRNKDRLLAYGLIPIKGKKELLRRYQFIQEFLRQSRSFGAQRRASEGTAARIALENLARNAGFQDTDRLMWQMETESLREVAHLFTPQEAEGVILRLRVDEKGLCEIGVEKNGKALKNIPASLKKNELAVQLKEVQKKLKQQHSRARLSFEGAMVAADHFQAEELRNLEQSPVMAPMLHSLVFLWEQRHGYWREGCLQPPEGEPVPVAGDAILRIAHPHDLYTLGVWADYQRQVFRDRLVQPFKQVFRELYRPTADELAAKTRSDRYAGHQVQPARAMALLRSRGWVADYQMGLQKVLFQQDVVVFLAANADWFSPADIEAPTLEQVIFYGRKDGKALAIDELDPILFSEVMRDVDLVVSVAHAGGVDPEASHSTVEMRAALLGEMLSLLKLDNVELRIPHAFIKGGLGEYTVHLGSGTAQMMATGSLFIVPVHSQHRGRLFLPFVDEDPKTAEVLSKIVLLAEDKKIKDPEILRQITRG